MQIKIKQMTKWLRDSGLTLNETKTEIKPKGFLIPGFFLAPAQAQARDRAAFLS